MENKVGIIIVVFNISNLIEMQINLIKRFCKDDKYEIIVVDNSTDLENAKIVEGIVSAAGCRYLKTQSTADFSQSHASACNFGYNQFKRSHKYLMLLDHDNFPIKDFSVAQILKDKVIGGVAQARNDIYYFWPGCVIINNEMVDINIVNFSTNPQLGLDTGGNLHKVIKRHGMDQTVHFDQYNIPNPANTDMYSFYNLIKNNTSTAEFAFMHFINSSNWNQKENNKERVESLIEILKGLVGM